MALIWKDVPNFEDSHEICQYGIIRTKDTKRELKLRYIQNLWHRKQKKHIAFCTNTLLSMLFDDPYEIDFGGAESKSTVADDFTYDPIGGEKWVLLKGSHKKYAISNYGRIYSYKKKQLMKPSKVGHQWIYRLSHKQFSIRPTLKRHFKLRDIKYDLSIPPKKALLERLKSGKIGVYPSKCSKSKWRYVIQKDGKHHAGYFKTKDAAITGWAQKYCELYGINFTETFGVIL